MVKVLTTRSGIEQGFMTTVHAYTNDQNVLDGPHKDPRRARSAAVNIIPTTTGAARAVTEVIPEMAGKLDGVALRVPVVDGSLVDLAVYSTARSTAAEVNAAFEAAPRQSGPLAGRLRYTSEPIVSIDVIGDPASCVFDSIADPGIGRLVKVFGWYDNEWGYTARLVDLTRLVGGGMTRQRSRPFRGAHPRPRRPGRRHGGRAAVGCGLLTACRHRHSRASARNGWARRSSPTAASRTTPIRPHEPVADPTSVIIVDADPAASRRRLRRLGA